MPLAKTVNFAYPAQELSTTPTSNQVNVDKSLLIQRRVYR